jgi:hypothetical protein
MNWQHKPSDKEGDILTVEGYAYLPTRADVQGEKRWIWLRPYKETYIAEKFFLNPEDWEIDSINWDLQWCLVSRVAL